MQLRKKQSKTNEVRNEARKDSGEWWFIVILLLCIFALGFLSLAISKNAFAFQTARMASSGNEANASGSLELSLPKLNTVKYEKLVDILASCPSESKSDKRDKDKKEKKQKSCLWPVRGNPLPLPGAILPFYRIVSYYGNFYSSRMGILGEYPEEVVVKKLRAQIAKWKKAAPGIPVMPAIDYIAITAQASAGRDGNYNLRMPDSQIRKAVDMAKALHGIVFLEVQVGQANLLTEVKGLQKFLKLPNVELAIDPEFSMLRGYAPGKHIGTVKASGINEVITYLSKLVAKNTLPPKVLLVHRFTEAMVQHAEKIQPTSQVQVVMVMDGFGTQTLKRSMYHYVITDYPVQFAGFKVFYKNDTWGHSKGIMTPKEILKLRPKPSYIQYQ